jgi:hypothetical protein
MLKRIGAEEGGEFKAVASGTLPSGQPVVVNSDGTVSVVSGLSATQAQGTAVVFESANTVFTGSAFDSNSNKVVIGYKDKGNSNYGTAVVGTVSGTSISFGTPVVFHSGGDTKYISPTFDTSNNKIVIAFMDNGLSIEARAIVGTVSGTSISFGSSVAFTSATAEYFSAVFDSSNNKVVICFRDADNSDNGMAIVGTVSGTSISFGSVATFNASNSIYVQAAFDSTNNKVIAVCRDAGDSGKGKAAIGTVSGTSISFGTAVEFFSGSANYCSVAYDTNAQKAVVTFNDNSNNYGKAVVGTVSGTSISFGSVVTFASASTLYGRIVYDPVAKRVVIAYADGGNSDKGTLIVGTVSGTSISFASEVVFEEGISPDISITYDSNSEKVVIAYRDQSNSDYGTAIVSQTGYTSTTLTSENYIGMSKGGAVADTKGATVDIIGSVNDEQSGLTAGQQYFVQADGTIGTTAATPSVLAGTAISATELLVKT